MASSTCRVALNDLIACFHDQISEHFQDVDWASEAQYITAACLTAAIIIFTIFSLERRYPDAFSSIEYFTTTWTTTLAEKLTWLIPTRLSNTLNRTSGLPRSPNNLRVVCQDRPQPITPRQPSTPRISFSTTGTTVFGYPSQGGLISLSPAHIPDFTFLALDRLNPALTRHSSPATEDAFCDKLLRLGAKWWDSRARYHLLTGALEGEEDCLAALEDGSAPEASVRESTWMCVAWVSGGGFVVAECDDERVGGGEEVPEDVGRLGLCGNMEERGRVLRDRFQGRFYADVKEYDGVAWIGGLERRKEGEHGELERTWEDDEFEIVDGGDGHGDIAEG